jgi:hypothetical protein
VFSKTKEELSAMVEISSKITVKDLSNKEQIVIAKEMRLKLRKAEIEIEHQEDDYRAVFNKVNKHISSIADDLKKITSPEIERIEAIEKEAKEFAIREERTAKLPERWERINAIGITTETTDAYLLSLDAQGFEGYLLTLQAEKNRRDEEEFNRRQAEINAEQAKREAEIRAAQDAEIEKIKAEREKLEADKRAVEAEATRLAAEKDAREREDRARKEAEEEAKRKEIERIADRVKEEARLKLEEEQKAEAAKARRERAENYRLFRANLGWTEENKGDWYEQADNFKVVLYKKAGVFEL